MLKKKFRLTKKDHISKIITEGKRISGNLFLALIAPNNEAFHRFAVVISKKVDKKAVRRNKCRRRFYHALLRNALHPNEKASLKEESTPVRHYDKVLLINKNALDATYHDIENDLRKLSL